MASFNEKTESTRSRNLMAALVLLVLLLLAGTAAGSAAHQVWLPVALGGPDPYGIQLPVILQNASRIHWSPLPTPAPVQNGWPGQDPDPYPGPTQVDPYPGPGG